MIHRLRNTYRLCQRQPRLQERLVVRLEGLIDEIEAIEEIDLPEGKKAEPAIAEIVKRNIADEMMSLVKALRKIKAIREAEGKKFATHFLF